MADSLVMLRLAVLLAVSPGSDGHVGPTPAGKDSFSATDWALALGKASEYRAFFGGPVRHAADGRWEHANLRTLHAVFLPSRQVGMNLDVWHPPLRSGDLVPVFGRLYRFSGMDQPADHTVRGKVVTLDAVPDDKVPAGAALTRGSLAFPLSQGTGGVAEFQLRHWYRIRVVAIEPGDCPAARLRVGSETDFTVATVRAGDALFLGEVGNVVRKVVPKDAKTGVIGWVELAPTVLTEADATRLKKLIVRPAKP